MQKAAEMEVAQVLHMNGGTEETSYAMNSLLQRKVISRTQPITEEAMTGLVSSSSSFCGQNLAVAEFGCASGPNTLFFVSELIKVVNKTTKKLGRDQHPESFQVFLNDLPGNDFNSLFSSLQGFRSKIKEEMGRASNTESMVFVNGVPGSFYGRLFPTDSLHFVHSSYSLHWLSQVPQGLEENKGNIYFTSGSPSSVLKAYYTQFQRDFSLFLMCRAHELVAGGRMVFTLLARRYEDPPTKQYGYIWELMSMVLNQMASEGWIDEEKLESFNLPLYTPSPMEVEAEVQKQGSFAIQRLEVWESSWNPYDGEVNLPETLQDGGKNMANYLRAVAEPLFVRQLGLRRETIDEIFRRYSVILSDQMAKEKVNYVNVTVSLVRRS